MLTRSSAFADLTNLGYINDIYYYYYYYYYCYSNLFLLLFTKIIVEVDRNKNFESATIGF